MFVFFFSSRRRHTRCALVTGVQTCALPIWLTMLRDYGTWELEDVLRPAIDYANNGFPLVPRIVQAIVAVENLFRNEWTSSAKVWLPDGHLPRPGALFRNPAVGATYARIAAEAASRGTDRASRIDAALSLWYRGFVAEAIDDFYTKEAVRDCNGERHCGRLRLSDGKAPCRERMGQ